MPHLHCRRRTWVPSQIRIPNLMDRLYYAEPFRTFHIAQTQTRIPTLYFTVGQESESESVSESVSGNVNCFTFIKSTQLSCNLEFYDHFHTIIKTNRRSPAFQI